MADLSNLQALVPEAVDAFAELWDYVKDSSDSDLKIKVADAHHKTRAAFDEALVQFDVTETELLGARRSPPTEKPPPV